MEKTYQIKIWKIIQIIFYNLLVSFIPFVIIGEFLLQIPQIFPVTFLVIIFYTLISCFRKEIIVKRNKISYFLIYLLTSSLFISYVQSFI